MNNHTDLNLDEVYISILYPILAFWLKLLNGYNKIFIIDGMTLQTSHRKINCRKQDQLKIYEKLNL